MIKTTVILMTPKEMTTEGYLKVKEYKEEMTFRFLMDKDFRGRLKSVTWNLGDDVPHIILPEDPEFERFRQVGERPEVEVDNAWFNSLGLKDKQVMRIKMEFDTFRMEPTWYGYIYWMKAYGDIPKDSDAAYKVPNPHFPPCE